MAENFLHILYKQTATENIFPLFLYLISIMKPEVQRNISVCFLKECEKYNHKNKGEIMNEIVRNKKILDRERTALLIIDIQSRIAGVMQQPEMVEANTIKLIKGAKILGLPIYFTEQYPQGLGETIDSIKEELQGSNAILKDSFSCYGAGDLFNELKRKGLDQIIVTGIETHVCVQQTVLDLLANGFQVNLMADAVSSRKVIDYETAIARMRANGAEVSTSESALFELLNVCGTQEFKDILKIVK